MKIATAILTGAVVFLSVVLVAEWGGDVPAPGAIGIQTIGPRTSEPTAPPERAPGMVGTRVPGATGVSGIIVQIPAAPQLPPVVSVPVAPPAVIDTPPPQPHHHVDVDLKKTKHGKDDRRDGKEVDAHGSRGTQDTPEELESKHDKSEHGHHGNSEESKHGRKDHGKHEHGDEGHGKDGEEAEDGDSPAGKSDAGRGAACGHLRAHRHGHAYGRGRGRVRPDEEAARC